MLSNPSHISIQSNGDNEIAFDHLVELELLNDLFEAALPSSFRQRRRFLDSSLVVAALAPEAVAKHITRHI